MAAKGKLSKELGVAQEQLATATSKVASLQLQINQLENEARTQQVAADGKHHVCQ